MRLTIDEYSKHFKMSKEMILSKLRKKQLSSIVENGVTYIITAETKEKSTTPTVHAPKRRKTTVAMVLSLYQKENQQLKEKILQLEEKIDKLIDDKEQMLRDEMSKIEQVYSAKDEQLKTILELVNTKLLVEQSNANTVHEVESIPADKNKDAKDIELVDEIVELKDYLKKLELEPYQRKIIKKRFLAVYNSDIRVIKQNGKLYLNFSKYDYSDLLEY
ncbi:hypothetical protein [Sulfurimonas sp.]|uniref:hypothetical protein n=1 Tax=Sulfurimonas sp. TaxID=2022749 RepID=UPI002638A641|nr:hypothetical protein [Sulfurimonas sp.]